MGFEDSGGSSDRAPDARQPDLAAPPQAVMTPRQLTSEFKSNWRITVISVGAVLAMTVIYLLFIPSKYEAFVIIAPVESRSPVASQSESQLQSFGLNIGGGDFSEFDHFVATLTSVKLAERLERDEQLSKRVFRYDQEAKEFVRPKGPISLLGQFLNWVFGQPGWMAPQSHDLAAYFNDRFQLEQDRESGVITITYQNKSRAAAEEILSLSIRKTDEILREEEKAVNIARHAYLEQRLQTEVRQTSRTLVAELLLDAEQRLMLVNVDPSFGARIVDGPTSSSRPATPRVMFSLFAAVVIGFMIGMGILVIRILIGEDSH